MLRFGLKLRTAIAAVAIVAGGAAVAQTPGTGHYNAATGSAGISCPGDKVVWVNTRSGVYHFRGERYFGNTKSGKYLCEKDADREGDRPTRNGQ